MKDNMYIFNCYQQCPNPFHLRCYHYHFLLKMFHILNYAVRLDFRLFLVIFNEALKIAVIVNITILFEPLEDSFRGCDFRPYFM